MGRSKNGVSLLLGNNEPDDRRFQTLWRELGDGAPTIIGFATLCRNAMLDGSVETTEGLSSEARTLLAVAAGRGAFEVRATREEFDSIERFLAVCVEIDESVKLMFRNKDDARQSIQFLEGFRQLCSSGLIMHHLQREFSLSAAGFKLAEELDRNEFQQLIDFATEIQY